MKLPTNFAWVQTDCVCPPDTTCMRPVNYKKPLECVHISHVGNLTAHLQQPPCQTINTTIILFLVLLLLLVQVSPRSIHPSPLNNPSISCSSWRFCSVASAANRKVCVPGVFYSPSLTHHRCWANSPRWRVEWHRIDRARWGSYPLSPTPSKHQSPPPLQYPAPARRRRHHSAAVWERGEDGIGLLTLPPSKSHSFLSRDGMDERKNVIWWREVDIKWMMKALWKKFNTI